FEVTGARVEPYAVPTLVFQVAITDAAAERIHATALRTRIQIPPWRRRYAPVEDARLVNSSASLDGGPRRSAPSSGRTLPRWFDALHRFKGERALATWDDAVEQLLQIRRAEQPL